MLASATSEAALRSWSFPPGLSLLLLLAAALYLRGWRRLPGRRANRLPVWRLLSFLGGLSALVLAICSPLDAFAALLLTAHMTQHLLLMLVAPPLILLGAPVVPLLRGLPRWAARDALGPFLGSRALRRCARALTHPVVAGPAMAVMMVGWHLPFAYQLALRSPFWHQVEHACFFTASLLFWWPVVLPWPARAQWHAWSIPPYLLAGDLVNTALAAFLAFSDRLLYPAYASVPRLFGLSAQDDQALAAALMWVPGSLAFLAPAMAITWRLLSPRFGETPPVLSPVPAEIRPSAGALRSQERPSTAVLGLPLRPSAGAPDRPVGPFATVPGEPELATRAARSPIPPPLGQPQGPELASGANPWASKGPGPRSVSSAGSPRKFDLLRAPLIGPFLRARYGRRALQAVLLVVAIAVVADGLFGHQMSAMNLAGVLPWTYWRALTVVALLAAGNLFCMACPFMLPREIAKRLGTATRRWPKPLRSKWLAVALLALFFWAYEIFGLWDSPLATAWIIVGYFAAAFTIDAFFRGASFCKYVCPIGQFHFVSSLVSPLEVRVSRPEACASCTTHDCLRGNEVRRGCELQLYLPRKVGNLDCTFCLDCVKACPHDAIGILVTTPGTDLVRNPIRSAVGRLWRRPDIAALALVFSFAALANAAAMVAPVAAWRDSIGASLGLASTRPVTAVLMVLGIVLAPALLVPAAAGAGRRLGGDTAPGRELFCRLSLALVPVGLSMWAAHFLFHLVSGWNSGWPVLQRAMGELGSTVLGRPSFAMGAPLLAADRLLSIEILLLDAGLLLSLYLGWRAAIERASRLRPALALISPWACLTVVYYVCAIWVLLQPMQMRGMVH